MMAVTALTVLGVGLVVAAAVYLLRSIASFLENRRFAKQMGVPVFYSPVSRHNAFWMILGPALVPILSKLPFGLGSWVYFSNRTWLWEDQGRSHEKFGKVFAHVTPGELTLYVADLGVIREVYARKKAFERSEDDFRMPVLLHHSVTTVIGAEWQRQRRITAPPFNESNMAIVWHDSLQQAHDVSEWWISNGEQGFQSGCRDMMTLALNVLAAAGLGLTWPFTPAGQKVAEEDEFSAAYRDNLAPLITNITMLTLVPKWLYEHGPRFASFLPQMVRDHVVKAKTFRGLMRQLVDERRAQIESGEATENIFLNAIIAKSSGPSNEQSSEKQEESSFKGGTLSEKELFGNIIDYNIAGHETTAHTLSYCFYLLSVEPQWQKWIQEEVDHVFGGAALDPNTSDYAKTFYRLKRCLALMLEMIRVYPPVLMHSKHCLAPKGRGQELHINGRAVYIPKETAIGLPAYSVHMLPEYWGPDSREWKPTRWIQARDDSSGRDSLADILESEVIVPPPIAKETFFPWSLGARDCPGKKFSQVEFVAVLAYMLRHYSIEAVPLEGETFQDTRKRIWDYTRDSAPQITMNFREPDKYALRLINRSKIQSPSLTQVGLREQK